MRNRCPFVRIALLVAALAGPGTAAENATNAPVQHPPMVPLPHSGLVASRFAERFPREHLYNLRPNDAISARAWTNFLMALDYERVYFLAADTNRFAKHLYTLDDEIKAGDVEFAYEVFRTFRDRVRDRVHYIDELLARGFTFETNEYYVVDRKNAEWPADPAAQNDLWRRKVKNEYLHRMLAAETAGTNTTARSTNEADVAELKVSPEEFVRKRYKQFSIVIEDSDPQWVMERFLSAMAQSYDPHSDYMSPSDLEDFNIKMKLSVHGIGALLRPEDGAAKVERVIPGGPADKDKRLKAGDKIIAVGQGDQPIEDVLHWPLHKIVDKIRGRKGTKVVLVVIPAADPTGSATRTIDLVRDEVKLEEQATKWKMETVTDGDGHTRKIAVVKVPAFYANTKAWSKFGSDYRSASTDVEKALTEAKEQKADGVILDLRGNGGGYLPEAVRMTGLFVRTGPVVQILDKQKDDLDVLYDQNTDVAYAGPLVVLVNQFSASASEILAGALQDYGRAIIVGGAKTHGKGSVQAVLNLGLDARLGSIKVTTSLYYRISGGSTQLKGVESDIPIPSLFDRKEFGEDYLPNALAWTTTNAAPYSAVADLRPAIAQLRERSEKRRVSDARFAAYLALTQNAEALSRNESVPLEINERRKLISRERELQEMWKKLAPAEGEEEENDRPRGADILLDESLRIIADFIDLPDPKPQTAAPMPPPEKRGFFGSIAQWLEQVL